MRARGSGVRRADGCLFDVQVDQARVELDVHGSAVVVLVREEDDSNLLASLARLIPPRFEALTIPMTDWSAGDNVDACFKRGESLATGDREPNALDVLKCLLEAAVVALALA